MNSLAMMSSMSRMMMTAVGAFLRMTVIGSSGRHLRAGCL
jgi:hypothetical protein